MSADAPREPDAIARLLERALDDVIEELRAIDPVDLVSFIRFNSYTALDDLVQSSTELFFRHGSLTFGWTAAVDMAWDEIPVVILGMEFRHGPVTVFFDLSFSAAGHAVEIAYLQFDPPCLDPIDRIWEVDAALGCARLPRPMPAESTDRSSRLSGR